VHGFTVFSSSFSAAFFQQTRQSASESRLVTDMPWHCASSPVDGGRRQVTALLEPDARRRCVEDEDPVHFFATPKRSVVCAPEIRPSA